MAHLRGRRAEIAAPVLTALFFGALFLGVMALIRQGGVT